MVSKQYWEQANENKKCEESERRERKGKTRTIKGERRAAETSKENRGKKRTKQSITMSVGKGKKGRRETEKLHTIHDTDTALALACPQLGVGVGWRGGVERDVRAAGRVG
jgi:hypothetical protein